MLYGRCVRHRRDALSGAAVERKAQLDSEDSSREDRCCNMVTRMLQNLGKGVWGLRASVMGTVLEMLQGSTDNHRFGFLPVPLTALVSLAYEGHPCKLRYPQVKGRAVLSNINNGYLGVFTLLGIRVSGMRR